MGRRVDLPNGAWAQILAGDEVSERKSRLIDAARVRMFKAAAVDITDVDPNDSDEVTAAKLKAQVGSAQAAASIEFMPDLKDATILAHVTEWSYPGEITAESLLDLTHSAYEALYEECQKEQVHVDTSPAGAADPESPTVPLAE